MGLDESTAQNRIFMTSSFVRLAHQFSASLAVLSLHLCISFYCNGRFVIINNLDHCNIY